MKTALLIGHLEHDLPKPLGFTGIPSVPGQDRGHYKARLEAVGAGFLEAARGWDLQVIPFGPGPIFADQLSHLGALYLPTDGDSAAVHLPDDQPILIEMGHDSGHDWGERLWAANAAQPLRQRDITVAYSTSRPLYGAGATSNTDPSLQLRWDVQEPEGWRTRLRQLAGKSRRGLNLVGNFPRLEDVGTQPGSGAGGGAAAWLMALGARAFPTGHVLSDYLRLEDKLNAADLVIIATPHWHSPDLTDAVPLRAAELAADRAVPTVGIGLGSSLSAHEQAQWGLHGLHLIGRSSDFYRLGKRVGQTWGSL